MAINKVIYGNETLIDITDTTATDSTVLEGTVFYNAAGVRTVGSALAGISDVQDADGNSLVSGGIATIPESPKVVIFYKDENYELACNYSFSDLYDIISADNPKIPYVAIYTDYSYDTNVPLNLFYYTKETNYIEFDSAYNYFDNGEWTAAFTGKVTITYNSDGTITKSENTTEVSLDNYAEIRRQNGYYYDNYMTIGRSTGYFHLNSTIVGSSNGINSTYPIAFFCQDSGTISALNIKWFEGNYGSTKQVSGNLTSSKTLEQGFYIGTLTGSNNSSFSLDVKRLADISEIPTSTSQLTNDSNFQTDTQVSTAIASAIGNINQFNVEVAAALPTQNIKDHTIYFVAKESLENDVYDEFMYINNAWEHIGTTEIDLTGYATQSYVDTAVSSISIPSALSELTNDSGYLTLTTLPIYDGSVS